MSREIKFRAWGKENKCWFDFVKGSRFTQKDDGDPDTVYKMVFGDNFALEQYTGLKDKNGKEIYEGDVLGVYREYCDESGDNVREELVPWGVVVYEGSKAAFGVWADSPFCGEDKHFFELSNHVEVIGNVCESPELLGGEK